METIGCVRVRGEGLRRIVRAETNGSRPTPLLIFIVPTDEFEVSSFSDDELIVRRREHPEGR